MTCSGLQFVGANARHRPCVFEAGGVEVGSFFKTLVLAAYHTGRSSGQARCLDVALFAALSFGAPLLRMNLPRFLLVELGKLDSKPKRI